MRLNAYMPALPRGGSLRQALSPVIRLAARLIGRESAWERLPMPVPATAFGPGSERPFAQYFEGESRVRVGSIAEIAAWLQTCEASPLTPHTVTEPHKLRRIVAEVGRQGYAYVEQELELGLCSIAVPVRNGDGRIATAINVSMPYHPDAAHHALKNILAPLQETAAAIESSLPATRLAAVSA